MSVQPCVSPPARGSGDLLTVAFGTTVAMWAVGYIGHMPLIDVPPIVFVSLMLACVLAGGWVIGRTTGHGVRGGLAVGLIVAILNLLIVLSAFTKPNSGQVVPHAALWVPGYFLLCAALSTIGAAMGTPLRKPVPAAVAWDVAFAWIASVATLMLISIGGLVTGFRAGMAVPDWPNTYGSNMFLYPLAKMTGGVFYEHAHRLLGSLVGLTTFTLAVLLTVRRRSMGILLLVWTVGACVAAQGIMGGFRVTDNNINLAVIHGFFAHVVLAGMVAVAALLSPRAKIANGEPTCNLTDRLLTTALVLGVLLQTLLGAFVRQKNVCLLEHVSMAMLVIILAIITGVRLWGLYPHVRVFARGGPALIAVVVVQLFFGGISLVARTPPAIDSPSAQELQMHDHLEPAWRAIITTLHQTTAAVLLGLATLLAVSCWRLAATRTAQKDETELPPATALDSAGLSLPISASLE